MTGNQDKADVLEGLAVKIDGAGLAPAELELFDLILARAASLDGEVEPYGVVYEVETTFTATGDVAGMKARLARGIGLDPASVWTDMRPLS